MTDDIIEIDDYEVKDKQIVEVSDEDESQSQYTQRESDGQAGTTGFYKSIALDNTALIIIAMVVILLIVIFIMTFE